MRCSGSDVRSIRALVFELVEHLGGADRVGLLDIGRLRRGRPRSKRGGGSCGRGGHSAEQGKRRPPTHSLLELGTRFVLHLIASVREHVLEKTRMRICQRVADLARLPILGEEGVLAKVSPDVRTATLDHVLGEQATAPVRIEFGSLELVIE